MRICQITPGLISIPPNGWGAIEKIIWEYKQNLELLGHTCDIKYLDEVRKDEYDVIHIHVANLALLAHDRGLPYIFTMHDHHTEVYGVESYLYKQNKYAIKKSILSFVPSKHLVSYFNSHKVHYLSHGVNTKYFTPHEHLPLQHELLCVGNNGLAGDVNFDRKGFVFAIEAARKMNLPITIAGPVKNNKSFFENNADFKPYEKLRIVYDLTEDKLSELYKQHSIFLHPSSIEAGHPNLTLLEAMASGLPVACTYDDDPLNGSVKIERNVDSVVDAIKNIISNYEYYRLNALDTASKNTWFDVVNTMVEKYYSLVDDFRMKNELTDVYHITQNNSKQQQRATFYLNFTDGAYLSISGGQKNKEYEFNFTDTLTGQNLFGGKMKTSHWSKCLIKRYVPYQISVSDGKNLLFNHSLNLYDKEVLIVLDTRSLGDAIAWFPYVEEFRKQHQCKVTCSTNWDELFKENYPNIKFIPLSWQGDFYAIYKIGCYEDRNMSLYSYKDVSLQRLASSILGLPDVEIRPNITVKDKERKIKNKYVCFTTESTSQAKFWNNPNGWQETINYLNSIGLEPVLIQLGRNDSYSNIRNLSGEKSIHETINYLYNCEFFIGLGSGLSWLSWSLNKPTILISGFSSPKSEFFTPYRVINYNVCNSCWNEDDFDKGDWNWCPKLKDTDRQFECSKKIGSDMVIEKINQIIKTRM